MSICANNEGLYKVTIKMCTQAIKIDETSVKAWYYRGVANMKELNFDEATEDFKKAIKLSPQDKKLREEF
jgi:tetratricopeptide (TPR) repeat protein